MVLDLNRDIQFPGIINATRNLVVAEFSTAGRRADHLAVDKRAVDIVSFGQ